MILKRISALAYWCVLILIIATVGYSADEYRKLGVEDLEMSTGGTGSAETATSTGGVTSTKIDATHIKLRGSPGRTIEAELATKGTGSGSTTTSLPWDNITGTPTTLSGYGITDAAGSTTALPWDNITRTLSAGVTDTELSYVDNVTSPIQTQINLKAPIASPHFTGNAIFDNEVQAVQFNTLCSYADNTCGMNISVSGRPATAPSGDLLWDNGAKAIIVGNGTSFDTIAPTYKYYQGPIQAPTANKVTTFAGPLQFLQTLDNAIFSVQDNGVRSGASTDNVTLNFGCCASDTTAWASCTKVFSSDQTPTGAAILSPTINNPTCSAGSYWRLYIGESNLTNKEAYINIRYRE